MRDSLVYSFSQHATQTDMLAFSHQGDLPEGLGEEATWFDRDTVRSLMLRDPSALPTTRLELDMASPAAESRLPFPPFTGETAAQKVRLAEDAWNSRDPLRVALAYSVDTIWRNRAEFPAGRVQVQAFLERKWSRELDYRLIKELWAHGDHRIAVRFAYEWRDDAGNWFRSYGNENWEFTDSGLMHRRFASINDKPIASAERKFYWSQGRRPDDHPGLTELGL